MSYVREPQIRQAILAAQESFRYFWRELTWDRRRVVSVLDLAMVMLPVSDAPNPDNPRQIEHVWVKNVEFDGDNLSGTILTPPKRLTTVRGGQKVSLPLDHLSDWLLSAEGRSCGAFTINLFRSRMPQELRLHHDKTWRVNFGDPNHVEVEFFLGQKKKPVKSGGFADHPMCVKELPKIDDELEENFELANLISEDGWTVLHKEAMAGNFGIVKRLVARGADVFALTPNGYTPAQLARKIGWSEIADYLVEKEKKPKGFF